MKKSVVFRKAVLLTKQSTSFISCCCARIASGSNALTVFVNYSKAMKNLVLVYLNLQGSRESSIIEAKKMDSEET